MSEQGVGGGGAGHSHAVFYSLTKLIYSPVVTFSSHNISNKYVQKFSSPSVGKIYTEYQVILQPDWERLGLRRKLKCTKRQFWDEQLDYSKL